jgi:hypothetical protein
MVQVSRKDHVSRNARMFGITMSVIRTSQHGTSTRVEGGRVVLVHKITDLRERGIQEQNYHHENLKVISLPPALISNEC